MQLRGYANSLSNAAHAAFHGVHDPELISQVPNIDRFVVTPADSVAGDHVKPTVFRQISDDIGRDGGGKIRLLGVVRQIDERQHGDNGPRVIR